MQNSGAIALYGHKRVCVCVCVCVWGVGGGGGDFQVSISVSLSGFYQQTDGYTLGGPFSVTFSNAYIC